MPERPLPCLLFPAAPMLAFRNLFALSCFLKFQFFFPLKASSRPNMALGLTTLIKNCMLYGLSGALLSVFHGLQLQVEGRLGEAVAGVTHLGQHGG